MATKLVLRNTAANGIGSYFDMLVDSFGSAADTGVVNTAASGTEIQWTRTAGGTVLEFISGKAPAGGFTLAGAMTFSIWAKGSNMNANCGARARVFKRTAAGVESEVGGGPYSDGIEFTTADAEYTWTGAPTSTAFAENDRIIVRYYITNVGTMGGGFTSTLTYNAANAATGDSFFQIAETVAFKPASTIVEADAASVGAATVSADSGAVAGSVGASDGVAATSGAGAALWLSTGSSEGAATATGSAAWFGAAAAASDGAAAVSGTSGATAGSAVSSAGVCAADGWASAFAATVADAAGVTTASGSGASTNQATAEAAASATASATAAAMFTATAATAGAATAQADSENAASAPIAEEDTPPTNIMLATRTRRLTRRVLLNTEAPRTVNDDDDEMVLLGML